MFKTKTLFFAIIAAAILLTVPAADASAAPAGKKDSLAVMGMYTTIRFSRGQLDDYIPEDWELDFFSREREGMHLLLQGLFTALLNEEVEDLDIVSPDTFKRLEQNIRRRSYNSFQLDANQRFNWPEVQNYCKLLNIRYALFGDVTKLLIDTQNNTFTFEATIYIYDSSVQQISFSQAFSNSGKLAEKYGYNSLKRIHPKASSDIIGFMRTDFGRAATVVYDAFVEKLGATEEAPVKPNPKGGDPDKPGRYNDTGAEGGDTSGDAGGDISIEEEPDGFESAYPCAGGDSLFLSAPGAVAMISCTKDTFVVRGTDETTFPAREKPLWPAIGDFDVRGSAMLALSPTGSAETDATVYGAEGGFFSFGEPVATIRNTFSDDTYGAYSAAGDIDGDGKDELILAAAAGYNEVAIYRVSSGRARLIESIVSPFGGYEGGLYSAAGDFDGDGADELVLSRADGAQDIRIYKRSGDRFSITRAFALIKNAFPEYYDAGCFVATGDFDGDKIDELAVSKAFGGDVVIYKNIGGKFTEAGRYPAALGSYRGGISMAAADFDGDGADELVLATATGRDEAQIFKLVNGKFKSLERMAKISGVFKTRKEGIFPAAGPFKAVLKR